MSAFTVRIYIYIYSAYKYPPKSNYSIEKVSRRFPQTEESEIRVLIRFCSRLIRQIIGITEVLFMYNIYVGNGHAERSVALYH